MPRKVAVVVPTPTGDKICSFCGLKDENELEYGKFHEYDGIVTHYYCLLLSSNMQQRGRDDEGILGFLTDDINKELKRGKRLACCYCKKIGATLGCCNTKCKRIFHFPCGLKSGSLHQFFGEFKSYCKNHRPAQKIDERVSQEVKDLDTMICYICYDNVNPRDMLGTLWAPCCKKNAWFHRICVQQLAMSAGYFFKCPLCNNKTAFQKAMLDHGIFIPSQDASWELVPNAFEELLYRHSRCDAHKCLCPKGREHVSTNAKWELTLCRTCGSQGIHMACGQLKWVKPIWECSECTSILNKSVTSGNGNTTSLVRSCREDSNSGREGGLLTDDESSDSDISVGGVSDLRMPIPINSASKSESSPLRLPNLDHEENRNATLPGRTSSLARSMSPIKNVTTNEEPAKILRTDDELAPVPKKPRISVIRTKEPAAADSDDDIIVISGPSRRELTIIPTNEVKSPVNQFERFLSDSRSGERENNVELHSLTDVHQQGARKIENLDTPTDFPLDTSTPAEIRVIKRPSSGTLRPPPVEIDLSEGEITVPESLSTFEIKRADSSFSDIPELNIKISNVTSLAPGAFDLEPEPRNQQSNASSNINVTNGGFASLDPIVLDERSTSKQSRNNNILYDSADDELKIVRFDTAESYPRTEANSVIYGLTIPGTNHTVPLIVTPPENCKSKTPGIHIDPNNPLGIALCDCNSSRASSFADILNLSVFSGPINNCTMNSSTIQTIASSNVTRKADNSQGTSSAMVAMKQNIERPAVPQSIDPKMWSVPLKSIVKGTITKSQSLEKSTSNITNNSTFVGHFSSFDKMNGSSVVSKKTVTAQAKSTVPNGIGSSSMPVVCTNTITPKKIAPAIQRNVPMPNELVSKLFALLPSKSVPDSQANATLPNGITSLATSRNNKIPPKSKNMNTVWAKVNGSYIPIDPAMAKEFSNANTAASTQMKIQKSPTSSSNLPKFRFICADNNDTDDSSNNCDGDAGSDPAVQPTSVCPTNARLGRPRNTATSSCRRSAAFDDFKPSDADGTIDGRYDYQEDVTAECPTTSDRGYSSNRTGLIHKTINLRDIKFTIGGPNIVTMTLYESYNVNIKVDTTSRCKYETSNDLSDQDISTFERTNRSPLTVGDKISSNTICDSKDTAVSSMNKCLSRTVGSRDDEALNESESTSENNGATTESVTTPAQIGIGSRGQDELKENRDPSPPSNNSTDTTIVVDRKSKTCSRAGVNDHSMRSLNEKEEHETINEKIDTSPSKVVSNVAQLVSKPSKVYYNGCKDTNETRPPVASIETDMNNSVVARSSVNDSGDADITEHFEVAKRRRMSVKDGNSSGTRESAKSTTTNDPKNHNCMNIKPLISNVSAVEIADQFEAAKRRRMSIKDGNSKETQDSTKLITRNDSKNHNCTKRNSLVNNVARSKRKWSETNHVCRFEKLHANNILHNGETATSGESLCCKVSIDLTRIREVLTTKLNVPEDVRFHEQNDERSVNKINGKNTFDTKSFLKRTPVLSKSRSFDHLAGLDCQRVDRPSIGELQRSKSVDNLNSFSLQYRHANGVIGDNRKRCCKRKTRSFEKHDCVR